MTTPIPIGVLLDQHLGVVERSHLGGLAAGLDAAGLQRPYELVVAQTDGLPGGTSKSLRDGFGSLVDAGAVVIVGPAVTDNCFLARDLSDGARIPCLSWSGNEQTRSKYCFQYQVGSLEEEPAVMVQALQAQGRTSAALAVDRSAIGLSYLRWFETRCASAGIAITARSYLSPIAESARAEVAALLPDGSDTLVYLGLGHSAVALAQALADSSWRPEVFTNTALMYGHMFPERRPLWNGWTYIDMYSDDNAVRRQLGAGDPQPWQQNPIGVCSYDMGRLTGEALRLAPHLNPDGVLEGLEQVKQLAAAAGHDGTTMTLGAWDRAPLKGPYLVLRRWSNGESVEL
jgi:ABC-type branched-subunit amino acid transport system substrate-binding protein